MRAGELYLQAALEALRANQDLFPTQASAELGCRVMPDDRPSPNCGYLFIALRIGTHHRVNTTSNRLYEECGLIVAVTVRNTNIPTDRMGKQRYSTATRSAQPRKTIEHISEHVVETLHQNFNLLNRANNLLLEVEGSGSIWPCLTPLSFASQSPNGPQSVGQGHFTASTPSGSGEGRVESGLLMRLNFDGGSRYTALSTPVAI